MLTALRVAENGLTWAEWRLVCGMPKVQFNNRIRKLVKANEIYRDDGRYYIYPASEDLIDDDGEEEG